MERLGSGVEGVLVGRGVLRNPWILSQAADLAAGRTPRVVTRAERGQFLLDYVNLLLTERVREPQGFRHTAADLAQVFRPATPRMAGLKSRATYAALRRLK